MALWNGCGHFGDFVTFCLDKMATGKAVVHATIIPLDGSDYTTWKLQCQMELMKDGLWDIVTGTTVRPARDEDAQAKFDMMRDKAQAIIVLSIDTGSQRRGAQHGDCYRTNACCTTNEMPSRIMRRLWPLDDTR